MAKAQTRKDLYTGAEFKLEKHNRNARFANPQNKSDWLRHDMKAKGTSNTNPPKEKKTTPPE